MTYMFFRSKRNINNIAKKYELFLDSIDVTSQIKIRGFDMSFNLFKEKLRNDGLELGEVDCVGKNFLIKRSNRGYRPVKLSSLASKEQLLDYKRGLKIYNKYKDDFERIHSYMLEKEEIMNGKYIPRKFDKKVLDQLSLTLGYREKRAEILEKNSSLK